MSALAQEPPKELKMFGGIVRETMKLLKDLDCWFPLELNVR